MPVYDINPTSLCVSGCCQISLYQEAGRVADIKAKASQ